MKVKMEVFSGDPPCPGCVAILALADEFAKKHKGKYRNADYFQDVDKHGKKSFLL